MTFDGFSVRTIGINEVVHLIYSLDKDLSENKKGQTGIIPACPVKSGWQDSNLRPPGPKPGAIPGYATSRTTKTILYHLVWIKHPGYWE